MFHQLRATKKKENFLKPLSLDVAESRMRNDRQSIFSLVRQIVHAQFELGDHELTSRLWQEVGDRQIDIDRIIHLMYGCTFHDNEEEMLEVDLAFENNISRLIKR